MALQFVAAKNSMAVAAAGEAAAAGGGGVAAAEPAADTELPDAADTTESELESGAKGARPPGTTARFVSRLTARGLLP